MVAEWNETTLLTLLCNYSLKNTYTKPMNTGCFVNAYQTNPIIWKWKNVQVVNTAKSGSLVWQLIMPLAINDVLLLLKREAQSASRTLGNFFVGKLITDKKVMYNILFEESVRNLKTKFQAIERKIVLIIDNWLGHPITDNISHVKSATQYYICEATNGSRPNKIP